MTTFDVTIPVLNEETTLRENVLILHKFLWDHFPTKNQWQIVIADNGSTDKTLEIAQDLSQKKEEITFVAPVPKGDVVWEACNG